MRAGFEFNVHRRTALGLTIVSLGGRAAWAQPAGEFRPTRMIVPGTAGSTLDLAARVLRRACRAGTATRSRWRTVPAPSSC